MLFIIFIIFIISIYQLIIGIAGKVLY